MQHLMGKEEKKDIFIKSVKTIENDHQDLLEGLRKLGASDEHLSKISENIKKYNLMKKELFKM